MSGKYEVELRQKEGEFWLLMMALEPNKAVIDVEVKPEQPCQILVRNCDPKGTLWVKVKVEGADLSDMNCYDQFKYGEEGGITLPALNLVERPEVTVEVLYWQELLVRGTSTKVIVSLLTFRFRCVVEKSELMPVGKEA